MLAQRWCRTTVDVKAPRRAVHDLRARGTSERVEAGSLIPPYASTSVMRIATPWPCSTRPRRQRARATTVLGLTHSVRERAAARRAVRRPGPGPCRRGRSREATEPSTVRTSRTCRRQVRGDLGELSSVSSYSSMPSSSHAGRRRRRPRARPGTAHPAGPATRRCRWPARSPAAPALPSGRCRTAAWRHAGERRQQDLEGVDRVEDRLLVLLQVAVVGQRQRLQRGQQPARLPISRPDLPRASSAMSGFFFCGMMLDPVE